MLVEIEITRPVKPYYTAKVYVSVERRKQMIDIPFPDRRDADEQEQDKKADV